MPITQKFLALPRSAFKTLNSAQGILDWPYTPIYQWGCGKMDESTPSEGLCAWGIYQEVAIVMHCQASGRTVLARSSLYMDGPGKSLLPPLQWLFHGVVGESRRHVDLVVLKGHCYAYPDEESKSHIERFMEQLKTLVDLFCEKLNVSADIDVGKECLMFGSLLVDKGSGHISIVWTDRDPEWSGNFPTMMSIENSELTNRYRKRQRTQDILVGMCLNAHDVLRYHVVYDVDRYTEHRPLLEPLRRLIRCKTRGEPISAQLAHVRVAKYKEEEWSEPGAVGQLLLKQLVEQGPCCEQCPKRGALACADCGLAWYCGQPHQKADWKVHRNLCRENRTVSE